MLTPENHLKYSRKMGNFPEGEPPKTMIFCFSRKFLSGVLERYRHEAYQGTFRKMVHLLDFPGVAIGNFGVGAPLSAMKMEQLIAWGVKDFYIIGLAGAIGEGLKIGDIIGCTEAIRDEGVSRHYVPPAETIRLPKSDLQKLEKCLAHVPHRLGLIWTFDAIYRETKEEFLRYRRRGVLGVEMETAALYAVAAFRKVSMISLLVISDLHTETDWIPGFYDLSVLENQHVLLAAILKDGLPHFSS
ncbi:MAG TPA: nucleoside phosphorylase [Chlamydiales bacterium]|nr:nucleoside phosphorylase [Chlamydiales bacterium]